MKAKLAALIGATVLASSVSMPAHAALLNFQLAGSRNASFQLDSNPTPNSSSTSVFGSQIQFLNVAGLFNGVAGTASSIGFGTGPIFADLNVNGTTLGFTQFAGPDLFSGSATAPKFAPGVFALTSIVSGSSTLTISDAVVAAVPEPASLALMLGGVGVVGAVIRRRHAGAAAA